MMDKMTASDKAFIAVHNANDLDGIDSGIDGAKAAEYTAKNATTGIKPGAGMNRTGDQKIGDKNIIKSTEAK
jgi:c-di-AMP phosphodiesterase-like protein